MTLWTELLGCEIRFIDVGGIRTRVLSAGSGGQAVVLLHGRGGHLESWRANVGPLAERNRVIAFDLLGHGLTARHDGGYAIDDLVAHAQATLDELGVCGAMLCGQSIGGWVAAWLSIRRPDLVGRLVLIEPAGLQSEEQRLADPKVAAAYVRGGRAFEEPSTDAVRDRLHGLVGDPRVIDEELVQTRRLLYMPPQARAVHRAVREADNSGALLTEDVLAQIAAPTLIIRGGLANTPLEVAQGAAAATGTQLVIVAGAKQWPQLERPELVNRLLIEQAAAPRAVAVR